MPPTSTGYSNFNWSDESVPLIKMLMLLLKEDLLVRYILSMAFSDKTKSERVDYIFVRNG